MSTIFLQSCVERLIAQVSCTTPFYAVCSPFDRTAVQGRRLREQEHRMWQDLLPEADEDLDMVVARLMRNLGRGETYLKNTLEAHRRLLELPQLKALQEQMHHLDLERLKAIDLTLCKADFDVAEHVSIIDRELTAYLTPIRTNQLLPSAAQIRRRINDILTTLDDSISGDDSPEDRPDSFGVLYEASEAFITLRTDPATANEIEQRVRKKAAQEDLSQAEAFLAIFRGESVPDVTLNIYRAHDVEDAPGWMPGVGFIPAGLAEEWAGRATLIRDMDKLHDKVSDAYYTPSDIRAVVVGLDGTCSYMYCQCPGTRAEMDHRHDHKHGGPTTASNLAVLCPVHHNIKTDGRVRYLIDPDTRDKYFLFDDGTWVVSEAEGPLTPKNRNWVQTVAQRTAKRRARIRTESQAKKAAETLTHPPPPEEPTGNPWADSLP